MIANLIKDIVSCCFTLGNSLAARHFPTEVLFENFSGLSRLAINVNWLVAILLVEVSPVFKGVDNEG